MNKLYCTDKQTSRWDLHTEEGTTKDYIKRREELNKKTITVKAFYILGWGELPNFNNFFHRLF